MLYILSIFYFGFSVSLAGTVAVAGIVFASRAFIAIGDGPGMVVVHEVCLGHPLLAVVLSVATDVGLLDGIGIWQSIEDTIQGSKALIAVEA